MTLAYQAFRLTLANNNDHAEAYNNLGVLELRKGHVEMVSGSQLHGGIPHHSVYTSISKPAVDCHLFICSFFQFSIPISCICYGSQLPYVPDKCFLAPFDGLWPFCSLPSSPLYHPLISLLSSPPIPSWLLSSLFFPSPLSLHLTFNSFSTPFLPSPHL